MCWGGGAAARGTSCFPTQLHSQGTDDGGDRRRDREKRSKPEGPARGRQEGLSGGLTTPAEPALKMQPGTCAA